MTNILTPHLDAITELCSRYGIRRLELFGSANTDKFDPRSSDIDFLVEFAPHTLSPFKQYFGFKIALEFLLGRAVDLVMMSALTDAHFIEVANPTRQIVYAAKDTQAA